MIFASDNWAGASPKIIDALAAAARSGGPAYGGDPITKALEQRFAELFEHEVAIFLVATGTVANALALSAYARPGGIVLAHRHAHTITSEAGATEFFSDATKIVGLDADAGKLSPATLEAGLARYPVGFEHAGQPVAVSITQQTEWGAVYRPEAVAAINSVAKTRGCALHMDGARFANAVAALDVSPADATWRAGVDVLSFGGTKNGCLAAEAVIFFNPAHARDMTFQRQRAGQGYSKNWFIAAQLSAYLDGAHWLELARHANAMAARLAGGLRQSPNARLAFEPDGNQIFAILKNDADKRLRAAGGVYHPSHPDAVPEAFRPRAEETMVRLVTSWQTPQEDVDRFVTVLRGD
jgi:threonine aldolase